MECRLCRAESGFSLVCTFCRRNMSDYQHERIGRIWHDLMVATTWDEKRNQGMCFHCENWFDRDMLCGDHWIHTKKARPDLRYDVRVGRPSCQRCNTSGAKTRKKPTLDDLI